MVDCVEVGLVGVAYVLLPLVHHLRNLHSFLHGRLPEEILVLVPSRQEEINESLSRL